jgi:hypothetical protein
MIQVYVNYTDQHMTIHRRAGCKGTEKMSEPGQRVIKIDAANASKEITRFQQNEYSFSAEAPGNDMWIDIDFDSPVFEHSIAEYIRSRLSPDNKQFSYNRSLGWHC